MKRIIIFFLFFIPINLFSQTVSVKGRVLDADSKHPLSNANVILVGENLSGTTTDVNGWFNLSVNSGRNHIIKVSYIGYETKKIEIAASEVLNKILNIELMPTILSSQTVFVEATMGEEGFTPAAFSKLRRKDLAKDYVVQDIPEYLSKLPSTTFYSENGNGIGYNYLSIRGFDQRRISTSINGIPQNDPEDNNVYWLDFPDLLSSTELIQVQRGAGAGVTGYPSIGGSINIITSAFSNQKEVNFSSSFGSYETRKYSASFSSGLIDNKYSFYAKLSQILSSGYRQHSWTKFNAYHFSAVRYDKNLTNQINFYGGPISDGLAYTGLPKFAIKDRNLRTANFSFWMAENNQYTFTLERRPEEIENFSQPHYELLTEYKVNDNLKINSALFLVLGSGFFDFDGSWADTTYLRLTSSNGFHPTVNPGNVLIRAQVENKQYGWIPRISLNHTNGRLIVGGEFRIHRSDHWGSINFGENLPQNLSKDFRFYFYNGGKNIFNGFVNESYSFNDKLNLLAEVQFAYHKYEISNERFVSNNFQISDLFVNPRFGLNYKLNNNSNIYLSFARVTREPRLNNYYNASESSGGEQPQFQLNSDGSFDFDNPLVQPEVMNDLEFGSTYSAENFNVSLNLFFMLFNDEIVKNGNLDRFGQPITGNVDRTLHRGIELSTSLKFLENLSFYGNATYSKNTIDKGKFYIASSKSLDLSGNSISGFPDFLANFGLEYKYEGLFLSISGRYVGKMFSDNFDTRINSYLQQEPGFISYSDNVNEAYFTANFFASYQLNIFESSTPSKIFIQVNNVFDNLYSAYAIGQEFFPAAERNFIAGINLGL